MKIHENEIFGTRFDVNLLKRALILVMLTENSCSNACALVYANGV